MTNKVLTITNVNILSDDKLSEKQMKHLAIAREIASWYNSDRIRVSRVVAAEVTVQERGVTIDGLYSTATKSIYLAPHVLQYIDDTVDTHIHEIAHHRTQAPDGTKVHEDEIEKISQDVIDHIKSGALFGKLKNVAWKRG